MYYKWTIVCNSVVGHKRASTKPSYKRKKKPWWVYCPPDSTQCSVGAKSLSMARWAKIINLRIGSCPRKRNALVLSPWRSEFYICNNVESGKKKNETCFWWLIKKDNWRCTILNIKCSIIRLYILKCYCCIVHFFST